MSDTAHRRRSARSLIVGFVVLAVLIAAAGYWAWRQQSQSMQNQAERTLVAVGELKAGQITAWLDERRGDAEVIRADPLISVAVSDLLAGRKTVQASADLQALLDALRRTYHYREVVMTSPKGVVLLRSPRAAASPMGARSDVLVRKASAIGQVESSDLYADDAGQPRIDFVAPVVKAGGGAPAIAAVTLRADPGDYLYPLIQTWPLPSKSAETLLVERRGDQVVYLNELRFRKNTALKLTLPLTRTDVPAVMAVRGVRGTFRGLDYRGVPVLSALQPVPGTHWFIVAKEDTDEMLGAIRTRGWLTAALTLLLVALAGAGTLFLWRAREAQASTVLRESEEKFRTLFENMTEGVALHELVVDAQGAPLDYRILDLNPAYGAQTGASADQVRGKLSRDAYGTAEPPFLAEYARTAQTGEPLRFQVYFEPLAKHFDITVVAQGEGRFATVFEDITERKRAEDALTRSGAMSEAVKLAQERFFTAEDPFETFKDLLDALLGLTGSEYGFIDELAYNANGQPELTARAITNIAWNDETRALYPGFLTGELRLTNVKSLFGEVMTTGKPVIANDAPNDARQGGIPPGHPALNAFLGLPLRAGEEFVGVIGLANAPGGYSEQTVAFLEPVVQGCANLIAAARGELRRRRAEEALQDSQHLLTQAEKLGRVGGWEFDIDTRLQTWTEAVYDIHEVEFTSQPTVDQGEDFYTPASRPIIERAVQRAIEQGEPFDVEVEIITAKGNLRSVHAIGEADPARGKVFGFFQDITERKRAEAELRETRDYLENLIGYANAPIIVWDPDLRIKRFNHAFEVLTQHAAREVIGRHLELLFPEDERRLPALAHVTSATAGERWQVVEIPILRADGEVRTVLWNSATVCGADGVTPIATIAQGQDITERKQAEATRQKFVMLADSSSEFIGMCDLDMKPLYVNPAGLRMVGLPDMAAACQLQVQDYFFPEDQRFIAEEFFPRVLREGHGDVEIRLRHFQTGEPIWMFYSLFNIRDASGEIVGWATVSRDITERKRTEEELRTSERKFRETIQALDEGYYSVTLDGRLLDHNPAFNTILGIDPAADLRGRDMPDFWWDRADRTAYVEQLSRDGIIRDYLVRAKRADGSPLIVLASAHLVRDDRGEAARIDGSIVDFTARHAAEEEVARLNAELEQRVLDRTAQLDAANTELEAFAYSVSHDLRAPLRHISGFSALLAERVGDDLDEKSSHYVDTISRSVREMGVLIDDLLQFSRTGRAELNIEPVDMDATLAEALAPLQLETEGRDIEWSIGPLPGVVGDHALLRQVWANLLGNAVKFSRGTAPAHIEVGCRDGDGAHEDVFWVRDNGVGFDMQYVHKLFGVFQRLHSSAEFEGTGIGLANVQRIVSRLGGRAWAEGEVGHGATFYFSLPRRKETPS